MRPRCALEFFGSKVQRYDQHRIELGCGCVFQVEHATRYQSSQWPARQYGSEDYLCWTHRKQLARP